MTCLPVLVRELRARKHSRAAYWGRLAVAGLGVLVTVPPLFWSGSSTTPAAAGRGAFNGLLGAAFLLCCGACLLTADAVSRERREGTLGLLLLTRVSHWDILIGKFVSSGLACFAGLVALLPVLALPLLTGGTTLGEAARGAAALVNTLFLALAVGLCVSSMGVDRFRSFCAALFTIIALVVLPLSLGIPGNVASPLGTILHSEDLAYRTSPSRFWKSICLVQVFAWVLLLGAGTFLRRRIGAAECAITRKRGERSSGDAGAGPTQVASLPVEVKCRYCGRKNAADASRCYECGSELFPKPARLTSWTLASASSPLHWLIGRQRGTGPMLWIAAVITASHFGFYAVGLRFFRVAAPAQFLSYSWAFNLVSLAIASMLIAAAASRFLIEARRDGTLELLLTTPLGAERLVSTQWEMIKQKLTLPLLLMLAPSLLQGLFLFVAGVGGPGLWKIAYAFSILLGATLVIVRVAALCWLALWLALEGMGQVGTIFWAVLVAHALPWMLGIAWSISIQLLVPWAPSSPQAVALLLHSVFPQGAMIVFYVIVIRLARSSLQNPQAGSGRFDLRSVLMVAAQRVLPAIRRVRQWPG